MRWAPGLPGTQGNWRQRAIEYAWARWLTNQLLVGECLCLRGETPCFATHGEDLDVVNTQQPAN
jgi:hypothetical protein